MRITDAQLTQFRTEGYVVVPGVLTDEQMAATRRIVDEMLERQPPEGVGAHFLWPSLDDSHPLLALYREAGIAELAAQLVRPELELLEPDQAQVATTIPPWPHRPGGPHVDGITPCLEDGTPGTFTMLAGLWLTSHEELDRQYRRSLRQRGRRTPGDALLPPPHRDTSRQLARGRHDSPPRVPELSSSLCMGSVRRRARDADPVHKVVGWSGLEFDEEG